MNLQQFLVIASLMFVLGMAFVFGEKRAKADDPGFKPAPTPTVKVNAAILAKSVKIISPEMGEYFNLCKKGGTPGLKDEVKAPSCKGHRLGEAWPSNNMGKLVDKYVEFYPKYCVNNTQGTFRCVFPLYFPKLPCNAYVKVHNAMMPPIDQRLPFTADPYFANDFWNCRYFDSEGYEGSVQMSPEDPISETDYPYFCNIQVDGPYSNFPDEYEVCGQTESMAYKGMVFTLTQKAAIKAINKNAPGHNGGLKSDLAGFCFPKPKSGCFSPAHEVNDTTCREPENLVDGGYQKNAANIHHIVPKRDGTGCPCGKNSMKNAAVISRQLNNFFSNKDLNTLNSLCDGESEIDALPDMPFNMLTQIIARLNKRPKYDIEILKKIPVFKTAKPVKKSVRGKPKNTRTR